MSNLNAVAAMAAAGRATFSGTLEGKVQSDAEFVGASTSVSDAFVRMVPNVKTAAELAEFYESSAADLNTVMGGQSGWKATKEAFAKAKKDGETWPLNTKSAEFATYAETYGAASTYGVFTQGNKALRRAAFRVKGVEPVTGKRPDNVDVYGDMTKGQYATLQDMAKRCGNLYRFGLWGRNGGEPENPNADPVKAKAAKASTGLAKVAKPTKGEGTKGRQAEYVKAVYALNVAYWGQGAADGDKAPSLERSNVWRERAASNKRRAKAKVAKA